MQYLQDEPGLCSCSHSSTACLRCCENIYPVRHAQSHADFSALAATKQNLLHQSMMCHCLTNQARTSCACLLSELCLHPSRSVMFVRLSCAVSDTLQRSMTVR